MTWHGVKFANGEWLERYDNNYLTVEPVGTRDPGKARRFDSKEGRGPHQVGDVGAGRSDRGALAGEEGTPMTNDPAGGARARFCLDASAVETALGAVVDAARDATPAMSDDALRAMLERRLAGVCSASVAEERAELELAHMRARLLGALVSMAVARPRKPVVLSVETTTRGVWPPRGSR